MLVASSEAGGKRGMTMLRGWMGLGLSLALSMASVGCDGGGDSDAGVDAGGPADAGCPTIPGLPGGERPDPSAVTCPSTAVPAPEELTGSCCYRHSNADQLAEPEFRLAYIDIVGPAGSPLSSSSVRTVLNQSVQLETFNWLFRIEDAGADGEVTIVTGFGRRQADGTYQFSQGSGEGDPDEWCPVDVPATLTGDVVTSAPIDGSITVPIFDDEGVELQAELTLVDIAIESGTMEEDRSCVGWKAARAFTYVPDAVLTGYVELEGSRDQTITTTGIETTVCSALAGSLSLTYCDDTPRADWAIPPDALCDATGCRHNAPCQSDVCDPITTCNAWRFVAHFAASGVDITNDRCGT